MNPIQSIVAVDVNGTVVGSPTTVITPSVFRWNLHDVSAPDAGRVESMKMIKMREGQSRSIDLEWWFPSLADASDILKAFNPEYLKINCMDAKEGTYMESIFYVGDRYAPLWNAARGRWESVGFTIIQQHAL